MTQTYKWIMGGIRENRLMLLVGVGVIIFWGSYAIIEGRKGPSTAERLRSITSLQLDQLIEMHQQTRLLHEQNDLLQQMVKQQSR